jgi:hypothetical protein
MDLAEKYAAEGVVGLDLCGDPRAGSLTDILSIVKSAKERGFRLTVHLGEHSVVAWSIGSVFSYL